MSEDRLNNLDKRMTDMRGAFDHHVQVYAKNGKELARLGVMLEDHIEQESAYQKRDQAFKEDVQHVLDYFKAADKGSKLVIGISKLLVAVGVIVGTILAGIKFLK